MAKSGVDLKLVKSVARTKSQVVNIEYEWVIENFGLKRKGVNQFLPSPLFSGIDDSEKWQLLIYPLGTRTLNPLQLDLLLNLKETSAPIYIKYKLFLLDSSHLVLAEYGPCFQEFHAGFKRGINSLIGIEKLLESLPDDILHVKCEIAYELNETTITGFSAREKKHFSDPTNSGSMADHLQQLFENKSLDDVIIDVQGQKFEAHTFILTTRSPVFNAMFQNDLTEKQTNTLEVRDIEPEVFLEVLRFIYTDEVEKFDDLAPQLLAAADKYMLTLLKSKCEASLARNVTLENCGELLILAHLHSANELKKFILDFVRSHSSEVAETQSWQKLLESAHPQLLRDISMALMINRPIASQQSIK